MDDFQVTCPYCGEAQSLELEPDVEGAFVQDCEVCCHPWAISVTRDEEGTPSISIDRT